MQVEMAYLGQSSLSRKGSHSLLQLEPNLAREQVAFNAPLLQPLRFREAISALHDVVISDLRFQPRDKSAYEQWKAQQSRNQRQMIQAEYDQLKKQYEAEKADKLTPDLEAHYRKCLKRYWKARSAYNGYLRKNDPELWRKIMPYDPVISVSPDALMFECFSADESSYGCLSVNREAGFGASEFEQLGTTNVDYSWQLFDHFQKLRSYRETRFEIDPQGFEVKTENSPNYREEKIDIPPGWLYGFMQIQSAMAMPMRKITLSREVVYSLLAWFKRNKAKTSPRAIRFELLDGKAPRIVLEPWEKEIECHGSIYHGPNTEPVRIWGRRRLVALARTLPLAEGFDVYLLGTGLPSFWVARMGEMNLTLGLSGWTTNDWTSTTALDMLAPPAQVEPMVVDEVSRYLHHARTQSMDALVDAMGCSGGLIGAALNHLAHSGQVIYDLSDDLYRYRQILPYAIGLDQIEPPNEEKIAAEQLLKSGNVSISNIEKVGDKIFLQGKSENRELELLITDDGRVHRGQCSCRYYRRFGLRNGPCRHLLALRNLYLKKQGGLNAEQWYQKMKTWALMN